MSKNIFPFQIRKLTYLEIAWAFVIVGLTPVIGLVIRMLISKAIIPPNISVLESIGIFLWGAVFLIGGAAGLTREKKTLPATISLILAISTYLASLFIQMKFGG